MVPACAGFIHTGHDDTICIAVTYQQLTGVFSLSLGALAVVTPPLAPTRADFPTCVTGLPGWQETNMHYRTTRAAQPSRQRRNRSIHSPPAPLWSWRGRGGGALPPHKPRPRPGLPQSARVDSIETGLVDETDIQEKSPLKENDSQQD